MIGKPSNTLHEREQPKLRPSLGASKLADRPAGSRAEHDRDANGKHLANQSMKFIGGQS